MAETVGSVFSNVESTSNLSKGFDAVAVSTSGSDSSSLSQEYENSKNNTFPGIHSDEVSIDKMVTESLNSTNVGWNNLCTIPNGLPIAHETIQRPIISVRKTEDLFGIAGDVEEIAGAKSDFSIQESAIAVNQDPGQQVNIVADNFVSQTALPQFDPSLRTIGSEVVAYPVNLMLRSMQQVGDGPGPKQRRGDVKLPPKIKLPDTITVIKKTPPQPMKKSIAEMLANRGVTVSSVGPQSRKLNPVVSTTSHLQKAKSCHNRLPTVDLTKESDNPRRLAYRLNRRSRGKYLCQICDKLFAWPAELTQHMSCHRASRPECKECTAQYLTEADLEVHRQQYHGPPPDMAIPIVDLQQVGVLNKLSRLGVKSVIPLSQLHSGSGRGGTFGLPVVAVGAASNPAICDIGLLGVSNILP